MTALLAATLGASAANHKVASDLTNTPKNQRVKVIVRWNNDASQDAEDKIKNRNGTKIGDLSLIHSGVYEMEAGSAVNLASDPDVRSVHLNRRIYGATVPMRADFGWVTTVDATPAGLTGNGTGVGIAMLDSGINDYDDLKDASGRNRIVYRQSFVAGDNSTADAYGHGSHVAGLLAGNGKRSTGSTYDYRVQGLATNAKLISLRVLDANGMSDDATVITAIDQAIRLKDTYNIRVMNLSLGRPVFESYVDDPLCAAVERAWQAGIVVVVAAGNDGRDNSAGTDGYGTINAPGNDPYVITVGAMNSRATANRSDDIMTSYSSKGPSPVDHIAKPDLVAPGNRIFSLRSPGSYLDNTYPANRVPVFLYSTTTDSSTPDYYMLSGTSMAAPLVSGVAAVLIQKDPTLTPDQVKARLMRTASKFPEMSTTSFDATTGYSWTSQYDLFTVGAGYLDVIAALADTAKPAGFALSPTAAYDAASGDIYLVQDLRSVWGQTSDWSERSVWGVNAIWGERSVWGQSAAWGTSVNTGFQTIWSDRSVWGQSAAWGTDTINALSIMMDGDE